MYKKLFRNKVCLYLCLIIAVATCLRVTRCFLVNRYDKDAITYIRMSKYIAEGNSNHGFDLDPRMPPLFIFLMAGGERVGIGAELTGMIISVLSGILLILPVFYITKSLFNTKSALISALLVAVHPYLIRLSIGIMRDNLFLLFMFCGLAFAIKGAEKITSRCWYLVGLFAGLATMTRSEGCEIVAAFVVWIGLEIILALKKEFSFKSVRNYLAVILCFSVTFLFATLPVQVFLIETHSSWSIFDHRIDNFIMSLYNRTSKEVFQKDKH